jgi:hypothetical protein
MSSRIRRLQRYVWLLTCLLHSHRPLSNNGIVWRLLSLCEPEDGSSIGMSLNALPYGV